jgi:hypothetical protein
MRLTCPACGAQASAEAWASDAEARRALQVISTMQRDVARLALPYLALFRPQGPGRGLFWGRACKLLEQLKLLVEAPEISWEHRPHRPNRPELWAQAMDKLLARPPSELPLKNHNYLRAIAYQVAEEQSKRTTEPWRPPQGRQEPAAPRQEVPPGDWVEPEEAQKRMRGLVEALAQKIGGER